MLPDFIDIRELSYARAGRAARVGTRLGRILRFVRFIRLLRLSVLFQEWVTHLVRMCKRRRKAKEEEDGPISVTAARGSAPFACAARWPCPSFKSSLQLFPHPLLQRD